MARYVRGETARITGTFTVDEVLTTPTATTVVVTRPDGTLVTPAPTIVVDSVGVVHADVVTDLSGPWHWRMIGTGAAAGVFEGGFTVLESPLDDLLRVAQFRAAKPNVLVDDDTIQLYIDAATQAIVGRYGRIAPIVERRTGRSLFLWLSRQASSITSIVESWGDPIGLGNTTLDTTDWTLLPDGISVRREYAGTHRADVWGDWATVTYMPLDTTADRQRAVIALVKLDLSHNPGLVSQQIADWSESYAARGTASYAAEREAILDTIAMNAAPFA
jgi:hypothetical protein